MRLNQGYFKIIKGMYSARPKTIRIHLVFHILLLEPAHPDAESQDRVKIIPDNKEEYKVKQILDI